MNIEDYRDIFEPFENLVKIEISGKIFEVPENNMLLRCFQYIDLHKISIGDFCWNGDCANCQVWVESEGKEKPSLSCRTMVEPDMKILRTADEIGM
jgi:NADH dehydrogenase/NADH:ubiquinone oxidoreductase subunit G